MSHWMRVGQYRITPSWDRVCGWDVTWEDYNTINIIRSHLPDIIDAALCTMTYLILIEFYYFHLTYKENEVYRVLFAWVCHVAMFLKCFSSLLKFHSLFLISLSPIYSLGISSSTAATHLFFFFCWKLSHSASLHVTIVFMCLQTAANWKIHKGKNWGLFIFEES